MLWWIVDNAGLVYLLLGAAALALGVRWWLTRRGGYLAGFGAAVLLLVLVFVLTLTVVTDRKRLVWTVEEVARQISREDFRGAFGHFADEVRLELGARKGNVSRRDLQTLAETALKKVGGAGLHVWNVTVEKVERPVAEVSFYVRPEGEREFATCRAEFVLVREGEWQIKAIKIEVSGGREQFLKLPF